VTVLEVLRRSTEWLSRRDVESARLDAELLVAHGLGIGRVQVYTSFDRVLGEAELERVRDLVRRRGEHVPVAYLVGEREFWSLAFEVDPSVLVPRPETEHVVEAALEALAGREAPVFADVGTGSGNIAIAVLKEIPGARARATDVSAPALEVARRNAARHGVLDRLTLALGDVLAPLRTSPDFGRLDAVLANPPYVVSGDPTVEPGVRAHEPRQAVFVPGEDPLEVAQRVAAEALDALAPGGTVILEVGAGSAAPLAAALAALGYEDVRVRPDLARIDRVVSAVRR
jgi:release factor glutamine methyltransferase